jgi:predicted dehydrogenase
MGLEAIGSKGSISLPDPWHATEGRLFLNGEEIRVMPTNPYQLELENVGAAIRGGGPLLLGRDDALGQARAIDALYRSAQAGAAVTLEA